MRVYLDMCCFNRPYDDQSQLKVAMETQCKLHIQNLIKERKLEMAASYMLRYECSYFISTDKRLLKYQTNEKNGYANRICNRNGGGLNVCKYG